MVEVDGKTMRYWRERRLLTLRELSEKSGVAFATLQRIESGKQEPRPSTLRQVLRALEISPEEVLRTDGDKKGKAAA